MRQEDLGPKIGYKGKQAVSAIERGKRGVTTALVQRCAQVLKERPEWLAFGQRMEGHRGSTVGSGGRLREAREAAGLTLEQLAMRMGFAQRSSIWHLEQDLREMDLVLCERLAGILGVSPAWLAFGVS